MYRNDNFLTVTQAADYFNCSKDDVKKLVDNGHLTPYRAFPNDVRYAVSMREVNKLKRKLDELVKQV